MKLVVAVKRVVFILACFLAPSAQAGGECPSGELVKTELPDGMLEFRCMRETSSNRIVQEGSYELLYPNGNCSIRASFKDGEPHGIWVSFFRNGERYQEGAYYNGDKIGVWKEWGKQGVLVSVKDYN
jgi:antitoxin component YwqK of YwqJK toxin-antitoxin module